MIINFLRLVMLYYLLVFYRAKRFLRLYNELAFYEEEAASKILPNSHVWMAGGGIQRVQKELRKKAEELYSGKYKFCRERIARLIPFMDEACKKMNVPANITSIPPMAVGGHVIQQSVFDAVLGDHGYSASDRDLHLNVINQVIGSSFDKFLSDCNPLRWPRFIAYALRLIWESLKLGWRG